MIVPFDVITIRRDVAAQMYRELNKLCRAAGDISEARERYRHEQPTPEQSLALYSRELDRNVALLNLAKLVLEHIIYPNFD